MSGILCVAKVVLAGRNAMYRESLAHSISESADFHVVTDVSSPSDALVALTRRDAHMTVVDTSLGDDHIPEFVAAVKSAHPDVKVVLLSESLSVDEFISAVAAGVDGYLIKNRPLEDLLNAMRLVLTGTAWYDPAVCCPAIRLLLCGPHTKAADELGEMKIDVAALSSRERQVVDLMCKGMTNKEIARELSISISTTKTHVGRIFKRLGIASRRELLPRFYKLPSLASERQAK